MEKGSALGIDVGTAKSVLAAVKKRGIDIILSLVAYTNEERLIGDSASNQIKRNFQNTIQFFTRLLGLNADCVDQLKEEEKYTTYKITPFENKKLGVQVNVRGQSQLFTPEQVLACYLRKLKQFFEVAHIDSKEMVFAVPSYFSNTERQAFLDAVEIADLKCLRLINESTAVALTYGFFRKPELPEKGEPRIVGFVDLGHSKLTVTIASFLAGKMKVICHNSDRNLGARNFDYELLEKLGEEFKKKYGCDPRKNVKTRLRLLDIIEKQRKILSANVEATVHCEALMEDEDLHRNIKRTEFEELIQPMVERFRSVLQHTLSLSGLNIKQLHSVEMVGEATRIPIIQEVTKEVFQVEQVQRTLNSLECVARGCSLQAAMLSPLFKVSDYEVQEFNHQPVSITYQFNAQGDQKPNPVTKELFPIGSHFPSTKSITFDNKKVGLNLLVHYSQGVNMLPGLPQNIAQYHVKDPNPKHEKYSLVLRVSNNIHQIAQLESVEFNEEWQEEEKIPVKKDVPAPAKKEEKKEDKKDDKPPNPDAPPSEGQQPSQDDQAQKQPEQQQPPAQEPKIEYEIKKKTKKTTTTLGHDTQNHAIPPAQRKQFKNVEAELLQGDNMILEHKMLKNELESFLYEMRTNISDYGTWEKYIDPSVRQKYLEEINQTVEWLYADGANAAGNEYKKRLENFKKVGSPVKERYRFYSEIAVYTEQFKNFQAEMQEKIGALHAKQQEEIITKFTEMQQKFDQVHKDMQGKQMHQDPGHSIDDIHHNLDNFKIQINAIMTAPPPKEEKPAENKDNQDKKDAQPADSQDSEMKDESQNKAQENQPEMKD